MKYIYYLNKIIPENITGLTFYKKYYIEFFFINNFINEIPKPINCL